MIIFLIFTVLLIGVSTVVANQLAKQRIKITWWDYTYPFLGIPLWITLQSLGFGNTVSMSNFVIEIFWIVLVSISIPWIRFAGSFNSQKLFTYGTFLLTFLPVLVTIYLRSTMPLLPE